MLTKDELEAFLKTHPAMGEATGIELSVNIGALACVVRVETRPFLQHPEYSAATAATSIHGKEYQSPVEVYETSKGTEFLNEFAALSAAKFVTECMKEGHWDRDTLERVSIVAMAMQISYEGTDTEQNPDFEYEPWASFACYDVAMNVLGTELKFEVQAKLCKKESKVRVAARGMVNGKEIITPSVGYDVKLSPNYLDEYAKLASAVFFMATQENGLEEAEAEGSGS